MNGNECQIKLLYTKVQLNSEGALLFQPVEAYWLRCAQPLCTKRWLLFFSPLVLSSLRWSVLIQMRHFFLSRVQLASELCLSSDRYSFICTVLSLGWCNDLKKDNKRYIKLSLLLSGFVLMCLGQCLCVPMLFISCTTNTRRNAQTKAVNTKTALKQTCKQCLLYVQYVIT